MQTSVIKQFSATQGVAHVAPLPPAHSVPESVRALNRILTQLRSKEALDGLKSGNLCAGVDDLLWSAAWEGARNFRDSWLLSLARGTRDEFRRDIAGIVESQPKFNHALHIQRALEARLRVTMDFAFRFLTRRHVCFLADALVLAFESEMPVSSFVTELAASASRSPNATPALLDAVVAGGSCVYLHQPERVMASTDASRRST